jgi:prophage regulatory protein
MSISDNRLIRLKDVMALTGLCRSSVYSNMKNGDFPASVPIGSTSVAWVEQEVRQWIGSKIEERNEKSRMEGYR